MNNDSKIGFHQNIQQKYVLINLDIFALETQTLFYQ